MKQKNITGRVKDSRYIRWLASCADTIRPLQPGDTWAKFYDRLHKFYEASTGASVYDPDFD